MIFNSVLLPAPFGPTTANSEPASTARLDVFEGDPVAVAGGHIGQPDVGVSAGVTGVDGVVKLGQSMIRRVRPARA